MKNKKKERKQLFMMALLLLVGVTSIFVGSTYAKYISSGSSTGTVDVAAWVVKVNTKDITAAGTTSVGDVTLTTVNSQYVVNGKVAPQSSAYGVFTIDPTGTEVAVGYKFDLGTITAGNCADAQASTETACTTAGGTWTAATVPTGLAVSGVKYCKGATCVADESAGTWTSITAETSGADNGKYLGSIALPSATSAMTTNEKVMVKVMVKWTDDETAGATVEDAVDDPDHTAAGVKHPTLAIPITTTVYQKVS